MIKRLLDNKNSGFWKYFYNNKLHQFGGKLVFESNLNTNDVKQLFTKSGFLQDILVSWFTIKEEYCIGKQNIWNNSKNKANFSFAFSLILCGV